MVTKRQVNKLINPDKLNAKEIAKLFYNESMRYACGDKQLYSREEKVNISNSSDILKEYKIRRWVDLLEGIITMRIQAELKLSQANSLIKNIRLKCYEEFYELNLTQYGEKVKSLLNNYFERKIGIINNLISQYKALLNMLKKLSAIMSLNFFDDLVNKRIKYLEDEIWFYNYLSKKYEKELKKVGLILISEINYGEINEDKEYKKEFIEQIGYIIGGNWINKDPQDVDIKIY